MPVLVQSNSVMVPGTGTLSILRTLYTTNSTRRTIVLVLDMWLNISVAQCHYQGTGTSNCPTLYVADCRLHCAHAWSLSTRSTVLSILCSLLQVLSIPDSVCSHRLVPVLIVDDTIYLAHALSYKLSWPTQSIKSVNW